MSKFCVTGSINMDLVTQAERFPKPGETINGISFATFPGGKGANQAVALARLGAEVSMVGKTGNDIYAGEYMQYFTNAGVNTEGVSQEDTSTGIAVISVDSSGENSIIIVAGANGKVNSLYVSEKQDIISRSDFLLIQLEIPMEAVIQAADIAVKNGTKVILDPAPAADVPDSLLCNVDIITPNETEAEVLTGIKPETDADFCKAGEKLIARGAKTAVMKAGARGAYIYSDGELIHVDGFKVDVKDTTAAGDTFNAGLAYALGKGLLMREAVRFANAAAAISTTKQGAQSGMPVIAEVKTLLN
ncbi:ribokinase [Deferribacteres bacterium DY0037]